MASCPNQILMKSRMSFVIAVCLVFAVTIIILDYSLPFSMRLIVHELVYIPEGFRSADLDEVMQFCANRSRRRQRWMKTKLNLSPSLSLWDGMHTDRLKVIRGQVFGKREKGANHTKPVGSAFHPPMNATYRQLMRELVLVFDGIAKRNNMTYFLYGGSLIGSYRHHGMIPWDDDVDIAVHLKQRALLQEAFSRLPKTFTGIITKNRWKLVYAELPRINKNIKWSFPFLDISFFDLSTTEVYDADVPWAERGFRYNVCDVFPLVDRPFWDMWLPAPRRTDVVLRATYDLDVCVSLSYSHSKEDYMPHWFSVNCDTLKTFFPFVERRTVNSSVYLEELKFNNTVIQSIKYRFDQV